METTTELDGFTAWLENYLSNRPEYVLDDRHIITLARKADVTPRSGASWRVEVEGRLHFRPPDRDTWGVIEVNAFVFDVIRLGADKLQIRAQLWNDDLQPYFADLCRAAALIWPPVVSAAQPAKEEAEPAQEEVPKLPGRAANARIWKATWEAIAPLVADGKKPPAIQAWLDQHKPHLWASEETLRKIIAWGEAGAKT